MIVLLVCQSFTALVASNSYLILILLELTRTKRDTESLAPNEHHFLLFEVSLGGNGQIKSSRLVQNGQFHKARGIGVLGQVHPQVGAGIGAKVRQFQKALGRVLGGSEHFGGASHPVAAAAHETSHGQLYAPRLELGGQQALGRGQFLVFGTGQQE